MKTIVLIADCSAKRQQESRACDLFTAPMFRASLAYAQSLNPQAIYILSVKHGLLDLEDRVSPYDASSITRDVSGTDTWTEKVLCRLRTVANLKTDHIMFLAGRRYRDGLLPHIAHHQTPMDRMSTAQQLNFLRSHTPASDRSAKD